MGVPIIQEGFDHEALAQGHQIISEHEAHERYDDMLDDCHEDVKICEYALQHCKSLERCRSNSLQMWF
jgi:predicted subunit of tRNA(5-methylaminomethyl-2-thiouridylate) methyltransferase